LERLRLTDQDREAILSQGQEKRTEVKRLWRRHQDPLEEPLERMALDIDVKEEPAASQPPQDQVSIHPEPGMVPPQAGASGSSSSKFFGYSSLYLKLEAKQEQEKAQQEAERPEEDKEIVTVISELDLNLEPIHLEENSGPEQIC
jgi:hypothetical protein